MPRAHRTCFRSILFCAVSACTSGDDAPASDAGTGQTSPGDGSAADDDADPTGPGTDADSTAGGLDDSTGAPDPALLDHGRDLLAALPGLWIAPVTSDTSAGDFPTMNMDVRPVGERHLFSRVDLDGGNNLRFLFSIETHEDQDKLVFRNGGEFLGILRDTRTTLVEFDPAGPTWRFCAIALGGCDYVDARFTLADETHLALVTEVLGMPHMQWSAERLETRYAPTPFPVDDTPGSAGDPFPDLPTLDVQITVSAASEDDADIWVILSGTPCSPAPGSCHLSRFIHTTLPAGGDAASLALEQIHPGTYYATAVLDRDGNLATTGLPGPGDAVSLPNTEVVVEASGTDLALAVTIEL